MQTSEAKARLPELLDEVERGETVVITRHGHTIARIVPEAQRRQEEIDRVIDSIEYLRRRIGKITKEEILPCKHEGRRY